MAQVVIENPILNSPYEEPSSYRLFDDDGITNEIATGRRPSSYFVPIAALEKPGADELTVEIHGLDVYDPTTGVIRNSSTDDIACWFIDTNYNAESFFVRHAYFTGGDKPYERLQRTLRGEIDEDAWASLYSTRSRPFPRPETGRIAVKVINHYGDEVLKVYEV